MRGKGTGPAGRGKFGNARHPHGSVFQGGYELRQAKKFGLLGLTLALVAVLGTLAMSHGAQHAAAQVGGPTCSPASGPIQGGSLVQCTSGGSQTVTWTSQGFTLISLNGQNQSGGQTGGTGSSATFKANRPCGPGCTSGSASISAGSTTFQYTVNKRVNLATGAGT